MPETFVATGCCTVINAGWNRENCLAWVCNPYEILVLVAAVYLRLDFALQWEVQRLPGRYIVNDRSVLFSIPFSNPEICSEFGAIW